MRRLLEACDGKALLRAWKGLFPNSPPPVDAVETLHVARTAAESLPMTARLYSHQWLTERGKPSLLPDDMKPIQAVTAIGVKSACPEVRVAIHDVMRNALLDAEADGETDVVIRGRMQEARMKERRSLGLQPIARF